MRIAWAALLTLAVAGCAPPPRIETHLSGAGIPAGGRYIWFVPDGEVPHLPEASRARLALALAGRGLTSVAPGGKADYLLLVTAARRGGKVGLAATAVPPPPGQAPVWIAAPGKRGKQVSTLALTFLDPATGETLGVMEAQVRHGRRGEAAMLDRLIDGAVRTGL